MITSKSKSIQIPNLHSLCTVQACYSWKTQFASRRASFNMHPVLRICIFPRQHVLVISTLYTWQHSKYCTPWWSRYYSKKPSTRNNLVEWFSCRVDMFKVKSSLESRRRGRTIRKKIPHWYQYISSTVDTYHYSHSRWYYTFVKSVPIDSPKA